MASKQEFAVVVDIGSTKIAALAGEMSETGKISVLGQAVVSSRGVKRGVVQNPEEFASTLRILIEQLEMQTGGKIRVVDAGMAGQGIMTVVYEGIRYIESGLVSQQDVAYLENEAMNMPLEPGYKVYHYFPRNFEIDDDPNVSVPVGHEGRKLVARYTLITAPATYQESVEKALAKIGITLGRFILSPVAASDAVTGFEEKDLGVITVDIGGGITKVTSWAEGKLQHLAVIPFAGEAITHDIREGCSILHKWAEQLKVQYGQAIGEFAEEEKVVTIPGHNGWEAKEISFRMLAMIIQARLEEIIDSVYFQIERSFLRQQSVQGIVLYGGTSKLENLLQLVKFRTGMDARIGYSQIPVLNPSGLDKSIFLTAIGLLKFSLKKENTFQSARPVKNSKVSQNENQDNGGNGFFGKLGKKFTQQISIIFEEEDSKI
jgi:cell division protein FtsA